MKNNLAIQYGKEINNYAMNLHRELLTIPLNNIEKTQETIKKYFIEYSLELVGKICWELRKEGQI